MFGSKTSPTLEAARRRGSAVPQQQRSATHLASPWTPATRSWQPERRGRRRSSSSTSPRSFGKSPGFHGRGRRRQQARGPKGIGALLDTDAVSGSVGAALQEKRCEELLVESRLLRARPTASLKALAADRLHTRRLRKPLLWREACRAGEEGAIVRHLPLVPRPAPLHRSTRGASPWRLGAARHGDGFETEGLAEPLAVDDEAPFAAKIGVSDYISTWEALALLVALCRRGSRGDRPFELRTDSAGTLVALARLRLKSPSMLLVALELCLDRTVACYEVSERFHIRRAFALSAPTALNFPAAPLGPLALRPVSGRQPRIPEVILRAVWLAPTKEADPPQNRSMTEPGQCTRLGAAPPSGVARTPDRGSLARTKLLVRDVFGENLYIAATRIGPAITIAIENRSRLGSNGSGHRRPRVGRTLPATPWAPMTRPPAADVLIEGFALPLSDQAGDLSSTRSKPLALASTQVGKR